MQCKVTLVAGQYIVAQNESSRLWQGMLEVMPFAVYCHLSGDCLQ